MTPDYISLVPHADTPPLEVTSVEVAMWFEDARWHFRYLVEGAGKLVLPDAQVPARSDNLWQTTCFEAFVGGAGASYREYNFAPSGLWATYQFDSPRTDMRASPEEAEVWLEGGETWIAIEAVVAADLQAGLSINLTAVIEEEGGHKSYWALAHPDGPPDFHNRDCFIARLPPSDTP